MGRRKTSPGEALAIKDTIVDAAEVLFRRMGYAKTTVGEIATVLGMSQANVYRYFPTKAAINEVICERVVSRIERRCSAVVDANEDAKACLRMFLLEYFRAVRDNVVNGKRLHDMVVNAVQQYWPVIQGHVDRMDALVREILAQGIAQGTFKTMDIASASLAIQNAFSAFTYPALVERQIADAAHSGGYERIEANLKDLMEILLEGLCA